MPENLGTYTVHCMSFQHMSSLQQALIPEIEERLRKKCENLVLAHDPENSAGEKNFNDTKC